MRVCYCYEHAIRKTLVAANRSSAVRIHEPSRPSFIVTLGKWMKIVFIGNFSGVTTPECLFSYGQYDDYDRYLAMLGSTLGMFLIFAVIFGGVAATGSSRAIASGAALYSFMLVMVASACFTAIDITKLPNGAYALKTLPSITSESDDFFAMVAYGVCGLLFFLVAIPGVFYLILRNRIHEHTLWGPGSRATLGSLFMTYRPPCWWYEFVMMGHKILMAMVARLCVLKRMPRVEASRPGEPHCGCRCHDRTAAPPPPIALPRRHC